MREVVATLRRRFRRWHAAAAVVIVAIGAVLGPFAWRQIQDAAAGPDASAPSCSWSARIEHANSDQAGLIRCYLRALAHGSKSEMRSVVRAADDDGPTGFSASDFVRSADCRSGTATVTVTSDDVDGADASVSIHYADGAREEHEIHLANPSSSHSWRFWDIGKYPSNSKEPPAVAP